MERINFIDKNGIYVNSSTLEGAVDFTLEDYCEKMDNSPVEIVDYDTFLDNVIDQVIENNGTFDDAIFIANDAYSKL